MVGHKFLDLLIRRGATQNYRLVTFCEEPQLAYDRVNLSSYFSGKSADELAFTSAEYYDANGIQVYVGDRIASIDRAHQCVTSARDVRVAYDMLVLATGSYAFVPPIQGKDTRGAFVYRTLQDLDAIRAYAAHARIGTVVGGGLLGLESASALINLGLETHIVEFAPRLMSVQVDELGGSLLRQKIEALGVHVHTSKSTTEILSRDDRVTGMRFADGS